MTTETPAAKNHRALMDTARKALKFLQALRAVSAIRALLQAAGYTTEEDAAGWALARRVFGHAATPTTDEFTPDVVDAPVQDAIKQVVAWAKSAFVRMQAALTRLHPDQGTFLFEGLDTSNDPETVQSVRTLLDRLDELESGTGRKATHKADQATLKTLASRSYTPEERKRVRALVDTAQGGAPAATPAAPSATEKKASEKQAEQAQADLVALDAWYTDWATTAKDVVPRRDHRIRLGLATRRKSAAQKAKAALAAAAKKAAKAPSTAPAVVVAPPASSPDVAFAEAPAARPVAPNGHTNGKSAPTKNAP